MDTLHGQQCHILGYGNTIAAYVVPGR